MTSRLNITCIGGQTATGKTDQALRLAKQTGAHIINFDSRQLYKYTTIVPGKDVGSSSFTVYKQVKMDGILFDIGYYTLEGVQLWLYDICEPNILVSSFTFKRLVIHVLKHLIESGTRNIIFVGSSYFYLRQILYGFGTDDALDIVSLKEELKNNTVGELQRLLPESILNNMNNSDKNNTYRLIRKIELLRSNITIHKNEYGHTLGSFIDIDNNDISIDYYLYAHRSQAEKERRIYERIIKRLESGKMELRELLERGYTMNDPGIRYSGYIEINNLMNGILPKEECISLWHIKELREAKKELTAFKANPYFKEHIVLV
jgi:tRNA dimethylallyltransferase